jgi:hypothetical protein
MKKIGITLLVGLGCIFLVWTAATQAAPKVEFVGGTTFDFGDVQANEQLAHTFVFKNTGDTVLKIGEVKGG